MKPLPAAGLRWLESHSNRWPVVPLRFIARMGTGHTPDRSKPNFWEGCTIPWVTTPDVTSRPQSVKPLMDTQQKISAVGLANSAAVLHPAGTVMLSRTASVGFSILIGRPMATTQAFVTWTPGPLLDSRYLLLVLMAMNQEWDRLAYGSTHKTIYLPDLESLRVPLPPLEEQRRIADFLDTETRLLDLVAASKGSLHGLLRERLNAVRNLGLDALREAHGEVPLRRMIRGIEQGSSPLCDSQPADAGEWGVLKLSSVKRGQFYPHENKRLTSGAALARYEVREGDLLVTRANTPDLVGDVAVARGDVAKRLLPDLVYRLRLSEVVQPDFVAEVLLGGRVRGLIEATARGSSQSMVKLRGEDIRSWPIPKAGIGAQSEFVRRMRLESERVQALAEAIGRQQQVIAERRQALITAAVTGQIDVTTARGVGV
ncbi:restriction endonuclease subunit S [Micromonospora sp. C95]|uniref:restriction endonuclease subunit S n=1 Tax=Micromonospora sp. C95 TaxID=2824882 RepID=UPI001B37E891|nr:restriction endonuclease subunit S [Micromonospora sp. C95]MBQ1026503.1 restriction endonuclease subunit S [Micromonospora sp. C95]